MWKVVGTLLIGFAAVTVAGCVRPVYDVVDAPVGETIAGQKLTADQVRQAIMRAGATRGWQMKEVQPFLLEGTLNLRGTMAKVNIPYSTERYSIVYKDSSGLSYDGTSIHKNYNGWIQNLNNDIKREISTYR